MILTKEMFIVLSPLTKGGYRGVLERCNPIDMSRPDRVRAVAVDSKMGVERARQLSLPERELVDRPPKWSLQLHVARIGSPPAIVSRTRNSTVDRSPGAVNRLEIEAYLPQVVSFRTESAPGIILRRQVHWKWLPDQGQQIVPGLGRGRLGKWLRLSDQNPPRAWPRPGRKWLRLVNKSAAARPWRRLRKWLRLSTSPPRRQPRPAQKWLRLSEQIRAYGSAVVSGSEMASTANKSAPASCRGRLGSHGFDCGDIRGGLGRGRPRGRLEASAPARPAELRLPRPPGFLERAASDPAGPAFAGPPAAGSPPDSRGRSPGYSWVEAVPVRRQIDALATTSRARRCDRPRPQRTPGGLSFLR